MVWILVSFGEGLFSGAMLVSGSVSIFPIGFAYKMPLFFVHQNLFPPRWTRWTPVGQIRIRPLRLWCPVWAHRVCSPTLIQGRWECGFAIFNGIELACCIRAYGNIINHIGTQENLRGNLPRRTLRQLKMGLAHHLATTKLCLTWNQWIWHIHPLSTDVKSKPQCQAPLWVVPCIYVPAYAIIIVFQSSKMSRDFQWALLRFSFCISLVFVKTSDKILEISLLLVIHLVKWWRAGNGPITPDGS